MPLKEKIVVLGAEGMLGTELLKSLPLANPGEIIGLDIKEVDICNEKQLSRVLHSLNPGVIINCAGFTDVEGCEEEDKKNLAMEVNGNAPGKIASIAKQKNIRFIHISTDYVFAGTQSSPILEDTKTNPSTFYGKTKERGEQTIKQAGGNYLIVRTSWLYGLKGKNFVKTVLNLAQNQSQDMKIVDDQIGTPTNVKDLAHMLNKVLFINSAKIMHITNKGFCSWYQFAEKILEYSGIKRKIIPIKSYQLNTKVQRPAYSVLCLEKLEKIIPLNINTWEESLKDFMEELKFSEGEKL